MPKFRRKPIVVVDEARIERRKQLTQQRLPELPQTLAKLQHVHQRAHILQTWKAHEDDLAIRNLQALDAQHQGQAKSGANGQHAVVGASSSNEMDVTHDQSHDAPPAEQVEHMDVSVDPTQMEMMPHAKPTAPHMDEASIRRDGMQPHEARPTERISLSSAFASKGGTQVRQERVLAQLRELEKSQSHRSASEVMTSADMERYLAMTMGHVETLVDKDLDPSGKPWSFEEIVFGDIHQKREYSPIVSPWSGRTLKPIIRKDYETTEPRKMALLKEIETRFHMAQPEWIAPPPSPIEYRYLRPFMLRQINKLLCDNFWAGIDVSESLLYPEFSIVAMYKELVIGCAFITTLGYITYIVVHPEWRSSDIGKFMMYHLIQTCHGKDITLHVSCNNPAIRLYQKFCFQPEERIPNFYDKYMPADAMLSRDAFFMRLRR
jgi:ribosomal protein S18 acetylase RimI-like enzyme